MGAMMIREYTPSDSGKLAHVDPQWIIDRIAAGALQREIAAELGVTQPAIAWFVKKHIDAERWRQVKISSIESRLEQAQVAIDSAEDPLMLARARESARLWCWRAEREHGDVWSTKPAVAIGVTGGEGGVQLVVYDAAAQPRIRDVMLNGDEAASTVDPEPGDASDGGSSPDEGDSCP